MGSGYTQADNTFQLQNLVSGTISGDGVNDGPLTFNEAPGFMLGDAGPLELYLASLDNWGFIGTAGGQHLQGNFTIYGFGSSQPGVDFDAGAWPVVLVDGGVAFTGAAEAPVISPNAWLTYYASGSGPGELQLFSQGPLELVGGNQAGQLVLLENGYTGGYVLVDTNGAVMQSQAWPASAGLSVGANATASLIAQPGNPVTWQVFNTGGQSAINLQGHLGTTGTTYEGDSVYGGIIYAIGPGPSPAPIAPGTPAGGDLYGTYPDPDVGGLRTIPLVFSGLTIGDVLSYNGTDWINAPGASATCIVNDGGQVCVGSLGQITGTTAAGQPLALTGGNSNTLLLDALGGASLSCVSGQPLDLIASTGSGLAFDLSGNATLSSASSATTLALDGSAGSSIVIDPAGAITLTGQSSSSMGLDASGDVFATASAAGTLTLTGAAGAELLMDAGANVTLQSGTGGGMTLYNGPGGSLVWDTSGNATLSCFGGATLALVGTSGANVALDPAGDVAATVGTGGSLTLTGGGAANLTFDPSGNVTLASWAAGTLTLDGASGANVLLDASGDIAATTASGGTLTLTGAAGASLAMDAAGAIALACTGATPVSLTNNAGAAAIQLTSGGTPTFVAGGATVGYLTGSAVYFQAGGGNNLLYLASGGASYLQTSNDLFIQTIGGNIALNPGSGLGIGVFGATPVPQYTPAGVIAGWTAGSSLNFLQTDDTFDGGLGGSAYTLGDVVAALKLYGWLAP